MTEMLTHELTKIIKDIYEDKPACMKLIIKFAIAYLHSQNATIDDLRAQLDEAREAIAKHFELVAQVNNETLKQLAEILNLGYSNDNGDIVITRKELNS